VNIAMKFSLRSALLKPRFGKTISTHSPNVGETAQRAAEAGRGASLFRVDVGTMSSLC
jgi:hypothetical protein